MQFHASTACLFDLGDDGLLGPAGTAKELFVWQIGLLHGLTIGTKVICRGGYQRLPLARQRVVRHLLAGFVQATQLSNDPWFVPHHAFLLSALEGMLNRAVRQCVDQLSSFQEG